MDYNKYFEKLVSKVNDIDYKFPRNHHFTHRDGKYYANALEYGNGFKFNFVISSERSRVFGTNFSGIVVELYIGNRFSRFLFL